MEEDCVKYAYSIVSLGSRTNEGKPEDNGPFTTSLILVGSAKISKIYSGGRRGSIFPIFQGIIIMPELPKLSTYILPL
jgi:hypothetical protein